METIYKVSELVALVTQSILDMYLNLLIHEDHLISITAKEVVSISARG